MVSPSISSTSRSSTAEVFGTLQRPIAVVAHDAGAANHIIAWLRDGDLGGVRPCLTGPALAMWKYAFPGVPVVGLADALAKSRSLISGTGWAAMLEHDARKMARDSSIKSIAVVDHWTNYRERFLRGESEILPDEIWVTDDHARKLAETEFPGLKVVQLPNSYLDRLVREVREHERSSIRTGKNLLYVLEPIRNAWGAGVAAGEFTALDFFLENMGLLRLGTDVSMRLRPHPSDPAGKYDPWIEGQNSSRNAAISLDDSSSLAEAIAWSDVVVGCQTYAMVLALAAGRQVISSVPPWAPRCVLPQPGIVRLCDLLPPDSAGAQVAV